MLEFFPPLRQADPEPAAEPARPNHSRNSRADPRPIGLSCSGFNA